MESAFIVSINQVIPLADPDRYFIRKMAEVLKRQGQIEPLQVMVLDGKYIPHANDTWANEIIFAARELGWTTLLIVEMKHYQQ